MTIAKSVPRASVAVCIALYDESKNVHRLLRAIASQTRLPDELVLVDDGSSDGTPALLDSFAQEYLGPIVLRVIRQRNVGPASARNRAWRSSNADVCVFTDGDCLPQRDWIEKLVDPLDGAPSILATGGVYGPPVGCGPLGRFIGYEIRWRYAGMTATIDCHGTYNLAVRRKILEQLNGFDEAYPKPSGEDFDLTYRIADLGEIRLVREAVVQHEHPERLLPYLRNQARRGYDRVRLYLDHPEKTRKDSYTDAFVKYDVMVATALPLVAAASPFIGLARVCAVALLVFLLGSSSRPMPYIAREGGIVTAIIALPVRMVRAFAWAAGMWAAVFSGVGRWTRLRRAHSKNGDVIGN